MKIKDKVLPPVVLTIICIVISALVIGVHKLTYVDSTGVLTDKLKSGYKDIFGKDSSCIMLTEDNEGVTEVVTYNEAITSILVDKENNTCAFEFIADGYQKEGIHLLVGIDEKGEIQGISFIEVGETKGIGTKIQENSFVKKFLNITTANEADKIDDITGATYSSKGMKDAVKLAVSTYTENKEAIFSE
ncbi:MAG: FMN-binding protein [Clostridiales bacterium]|nr:FMN-binding protein [Clostridiales bacterium]